MNGLIPACLSARLIKWNCISLLNWMPIGLMICPNIFQKEVPDIKEVMIPFQGALSNPYIIYSHPLRGILPTFPLLFASAGAWNVMYCHFKHWVYLFFWCILRRSLSRIAHIAHNLEADQSKPSRGEERRTCCWKTPVLWHRCRFNIPAKW